MAHQQAMRTSRVWLPAIAFTVIAAVVVARLVQIQVLEHDRYAEEARSELFTSDTLFERRGAILDRNGFLLAMSTDTWDLYVASRVWNDDSVAREASEAISEATGHDATYLRTVVRESGLVDVLVARDVSYDAGKALLDANVPGLIGLPNTVRVHPAGNLASSVIGIIGAENTGLTGIEAWYDVILLGTPGRVIFERDTTGSPIPYGETFTTEAVPGPDIILTIDRRMQVSAERMLQEAVEKHEATRGSIIIMDPRNGEILALATYPRLDFGSLDLSDPEDVKLLRNSAVSDVYEPGSVMKVITTAAAIDAGLVTPETTFEDTGIAYVYGIPIFNWNNGVYGEQTMTGVLQQSINTGAVFMMEKLGVGLFHEYLEAFGFGKPTGIDLSGEATGIVRHPTDPDWSPVDAAAQSFGQAISVTPIQIVSALAAVINGGQLIEPRLVKALVARDGTRREVPAEVVGQPISAETSATMREMLGSVVDPGWYHPAKPRLYTAGGKSGTANVPIDASYDETQIVSFAGFAPVGDPRVLILIKLDENADLETGTEAAGPVFATLVDEILGYLGVVPDVEQVAAR
jgi:cell division protein FtsI/penicillin-binding protein 2